MRHREGSGGVAIQERASGADRRASPPVGADVDDLLRRIVRRDLRALREQDAATGTPALHEVMHLYRDSGFLYPEKLEKLGPRLPSIEGTWGRLLDADEDVFKIWMRWMVSGRVAIPGASICAFETEPGTWNTQHIVGLRNAPPTSMVTLINGVRRWCERRRSVRHVRMTYRPTNRYVQPLFDAIAAGMPPGRSTRRDYDYAFLPLAELPDAGLPAEPARAGLRTVRASGEDEVAVVEFLESHLPAPIFEALRFDDPRLATLDARYQARGLVRQREVLAVRRGDATLGAAVCAFGSEGMSFSFFENATTEVVLATSLDAPGRRAVLGTLLDAARSLYRSRGRSELVLMVDPSLRALRRDLGYAREGEKHYRSVTFESAEATWAAVSDATLAHYRDALLRTGRRGRARPPAEVPTERPARTARDAA